MWQCCLYAGRQFTNSIAAKHSEVFNWKKTKGAAKYTQNSVELIESSSSA